MKLPFAEYSDLRVWSTLDLYPTIYPSTTMLFSYGQGDPIPANDSRPPVSPWRGAGEQETNVRNPRVWDYFQQGAVTHLEGSVLAGHDEPALCAALEQVKLTLEVGDRFICSRTAASITPHDSMLEARVSALESMLAHLLKLAKGDESGEQEARLRNALIKLGWKPTAIDHRRMAAPALIERGQKYAVRVDAGSNLPIQNFIRLRITLGGVVKFL